MTQKLLYDNLVKLCSTSEVFYFKDEVNLTKMYRIFNYRLASYTDFLQPAALNCRGIMFEIDDSGEFIRLASRTMEKFFNYNENPISMLHKDVPSTELELAIDKLDGSLISSFMNEDLRVQLKSKGSLFSDHATLANKLLHQDKDIENEINYLETIGYTVNLELLSPELRIVVPYQEDEIRFLNAIHRETGEYLSSYTLELKCPVLYSTSVYNNGAFSKNITIYSTIAQTVEAVRTMTSDIEGFVFKLKSGLYFKVKTDKYCSLHHRKDSVLINSRLFEVVLCEASDDLRQLFENDPYSLEKIEKMERFVFSIYNSIIRDVETFYEKHKHLERKEYAQVVLEKVPSEFNRQGLCFMLHQNRTPDYKENLRKYSKEVLLKF